MTTIKGSGGGVIARGLSAGYGAFTILAELDFSLPANGIVVLTGPGGSGKSTLLRALADERQPSDTFWWDGDLQLPFVRCSYLAQKPTRRSCSDGEGAEPSLERLLQSGESAIQVAERIWHCSSLVAERLADLLVTPIDELPMAQQKLVRLTLAAASRCDALLLDEPEWGLSEEEQQWLEGLLRSQGGTKNTVVVTHNLRFARAVADYVMFLVDGEIIEAGPVRQFFEQPRQSRTQDFLRFGS